MKIDQKAIVLRLEGRVQIFFAGEWIVRARVRGDSGIYDTQWDRYNGWSCTAWDMATARIVEPWRW